MLPTAAEANSGAAVFLPPLGELVLSAIIILLIAIALTVFALPKYSKLVEQRAQILRDGIEATEKAKEHAASAAAAAEATITAAHAEAAQIRETAHADGKGIVNEARAKAKSESERITAAAKRQIEADRKAAQVSLRSEVGELASQLADRIVGEHLQDEALSARVIDRFLAEIDQQDTPAKQEQHS